MPTLDRVRIETFEEGQVVQSLFVGHPAKKEPLIEKIKVFAREQGYEPQGKYHEIYLTNPMRVPLEECQTVVRWPVVKE